MFDWLTLRASCEHHVARELARPLVQENSGWQAWPKETENQLPNARDKINKLSNIELLELIAEVAGSHA